MDGTAELETPVVEAADTGVEEELLVEDVSIDGMCGVYQSVSDLLDRALDVHPSVAVRPEPFGALLYHFGTRRLSFLKDPRVLALVRELPAAATVREACDTVGLPPDGRAPFLTALEVLLRTDMLVPRETGDRP